MIDRENVERLGEALGQAIKDHYLANPTSPHRVLEALNALGIAAASVLGGIEDEDIRGRLGAFLLQTIGVNIPEIQRLHRQSKTDG
jgi:hypothetical protein